MTVWDDEHWRAMFASVARSETRRSNRRAVYGADFPEEVDPNSYVTLTELRRMAQALAVGPGHTFIDLGCGRGGPGLWVARETGASLIGLDPIAVALEQAADRARAFGVADRARFQVGDVQATGLEPASLDGAMSVDALIFVDDKPAAFAEVARILQPGARLTFTIWESDRPRLAGNTTAQLADYRPLLADSGFSIEAYDEPPLWREQMRAVYERDVAEGDKLLAEMGHAVGKRMIDQATEGLENLNDRRRIFAVARRN